MLKLLLLISWLLTDLKAVDMFPLCADCLPFTIFLGADLTELSDWLDSVIGRTRGINIVRLQLDVDIKLTTSSVLLLIQA